MERFYLDTNIIFSYFLKKFSEKKGRKIEAKIANFLMNSSQRVKYVVSALTKAEIVRKLRSEFNSEEDDIKEMWEDFLYDVSPLYISVTQSLDEIYEEITKIVFKIPIKKRVTNLEHLIIAKKNDLIFVTGDKEIVEKCRAFYEKVWDYRTLRRAYENLK